MYLLLFQYRKFISKILFLGCILVVVSCTTTPTYESNKIISETDSELILNKSKIPKNLNKLLRQHKNKNINESDDILLEMLTASVNEKKWRIAKNILNEIDTTDFNLEQLTQYSIDISQYWIEEKQFDMAREWLFGPFIKNNFSYMSNTEKANILMLRAEVLYAKGEMLLSLYDRILLNNLTNDLQQKKYNLRKTWTTSLKASSHREK